MTDKADDAVLGALTGAQISGLFDALPELPGNWARLAGTDPGLLGQRTPGALAAVRAALADHQGALLAELARTGLPAVLSALDASEGEDEGEEDLADFAAAAGRVLGPVAAPAFLIAVASGGDPFALEVSGRLSELRAIAADAVPGGAAGSGAETTASSPGRPTGDGGAAGGDATSPAVTIAALTARTEDLIQLGAVLAGQVRAAADNVAAGRPAALAGRELAGWSGAVEDHLAAAGPVAAASDLMTLRARLAELTARAAEARAAEARAATAPGRARPTQEALRAARVLHDQGLDALIPALLRGAGFGAAEDWQAVLSPDAEPAQAGTAGPAWAEPPHAPAAGAERAADTRSPAEPRSEAEARPEALAQLEPEAGPGAEDGTGAAAQRGEGGQQEPPVQPESETQPQPAVQPQPEAEAELAAAPPPEVHPDTTAQPEPEAQTEPLAEPARRPTAPVRWAFAAPPAVTTPAMPAPSVTAPALTAPAVTAPEPRAAAAPAPAGGHEPELAPEPAAGPTMDEVQFPWDGAPSLIASLLCAGQDARAVCLAEAAEEPAARQRLLRFFCAAFSCSPAALELQMPALSPPDSEVKELTADECRLLLATVLRVGLSVGYSPVDLPSLIDQAEIGTAQMRAVVAAAAEVIRQDYRRETGAAVMQRADLVPAWAAFGVRASRLRESLSRGKLPLQRASNVLRHMVLPDEPVGRALVLVTDLAELGIGAANTESQAEKWAHLEEIAGKLSTAGGRGRLISDVDEAVSRGTQLRKRIVGVAMARLDGALQETGKLIADFLAARTAIRQASAEADLRSAETLPKALDELDDPGQPGTAGDAALRRLTDWLRAGAHPAAGASVDALVDDELTPLYEIPRDAAGSPERVPTAAEARELLRGRELPAVVAGYLRTGNIAAARGLVAKADEADQAALDDAVQSGLQAARRRYSQALASVYGIAGRLRALYDDASARELTVLADRAQAPQDDRFDLATGRLLAAVTAGEERLRGYREELRARARRCDCDEAGRQRILSLIDREDEVLAVEFLTMAEAGQPLPEGDAEDGDDFAAFFPAMVDVAVAAARQRRDAVAAVRAYAGVTGTPANRRLADGLSAWRELKSGKRASPGESFRKLVADVLRMIGLVPRDQTWLQELSRTQRSGYATFRLRATPIDRSYVPGLGTQAGSDYDLTLVWDEVTSTRLLDFVDERRRTRANIIVYFNTLDPAQRLQLRRSTRHNVGKGFSPVVVDDAVAAWLSTLAEPGWRFTQRVTLPFTTMNPYSPFAGGEVPEEVFVGREQERAEIESPTGSMFVYGGRQLGKSALLRRVERMFADPLPPPHAGAWQPRSGRVAVYLDLKAASIGEAREPSALWPVLAERLVAEQVLPREASRTTAPDKVSKMISDWLSADSGNRLLLLLDEADNFLTKDSRARRSGSGTEFPNLQRLKELMGNSERRFKAVFAGLHQVQRFHDSSNTPVAHGGNDILIGQLLPIAAYQLVVDPMTALGYEFASEEHVWRLLLFANYQASLVQIVCEALVREMSRKELPPGGRRIVIDAADIEAVISKREVRDLIVQRFWWTINLDPRYRVIALVVAARGLDGEPGETFTPEDLHEFCELYWEAGFSRAQLSGKEFRRYLEEMVGLGVLYRQDDEFGLRSPNILSLLGTRQSIDQDLNDAPRELEVRDEYNPSTNRRIIGKSTELWVPRSPLTDRDIAGLLGIDGQPHGRVQLVTGSTALGIGRAAAVIRDVAEEQEIRCEIRHQGELYSPPRRRSHLVVDLSGAPSAAGDLPVTYLKLSEFADVRSTIIVGPECVPLRLEGLAGADVTPVRRWSAEGLRSWHDTPFTTPDMRGRLYRVTSGWPLLVEETMKEITAGKSPDDALSLILERLAQPFFARKHLASCGIDAGLATRWAANFGVVGDDGLAEAFPVTADELGAELGLDVRPVLERLQVLDAVEDTPNGWVLDRAVFAAAVALGA